MNKFEKKYGVDAEFAAEYITLGTDTTNIYDASIAIDSCPLNQQSITERFNVTDYSEAVQDIWSWLSYGMLAQDHADLTNPFK
jgi:hypothetical protein